MGKTGEKSPSVSSRGRRKVTILQYKVQELSPLQACIHKSLQSLCDPMDCSPPCSSVHRILQARILEWVAMLSCRGYSWPRNWTHVSSSPALAGGFFTSGTTWEAPSLRVKVAQSCPTLQPHGLHSPWNSPGQNTGVGSLSLLQGIFPTQGSNLGLPTWRILYQLSHKGSPRILEWVAYPFSRRSSQPRNWTRVSCIAGGFFTNWAIPPREWLYLSELYLTGEKGSKIT